MFGKKVYEILQNLYDIKRELQQVKHGLKCIEKSSGEKEGRVEKGFPFITCNLPVAQEAAERKQKYFKEKGREPTHVCIFENSLDPDMDDYSLCHGGTLLGMTVMLVKNKENHLKVLG